MAERGVTVAELINKVPVEVGLQTETGYPHTGTLDYVAPEIDTSTGTVKAKAEFANADEGLFPNHHLPALKAEARANYADFFPMFNVPFRFGGPWSPADDENRADVVVIGGGYTGCGPRSA